ncbi:MAG: Ig-like domain-containing protein [Hormoscilla sp.]
MPNNNTLDTAENIGILSGTETFNEFVGTDDRNDYYGFTLDQPSNFSLLLTDLGDEAEVQLIADLDGDGLVDSGEVLRGVNLSDSSDRRIFLPLGAGTYFINVYTDDDTDSTDYTLEVETNAIVFTTISDPGNLFDAALDIGTLSDSKTFEEFVGTFDSRDYYRFTIDQPSNFNLRLSDLEDDVEVQLLADLNDDTQITTNEFLRETDLRDSSNDRAFGITLGPETYFLRVYTESRSINTNYTLDVSATATPPTTPFDPEFNSPLDIGTLSGSQTYGEFVGTFDSSDYYRFTIDQPSNFNLLLRGLRQDAEVQLLADFNDDTQITSSEVLRETELYRTSSDRGISVTLGPATYSIRVYRDESITNNTNYFLDVSATATPPTTPFDPGFNTPLDIGTLSERKTFREFLGTFDRSDYYSFSIDQPSNFSLLLSGLRQDAEVELFADLDGNGEIDFSEDLRETNLYRSSSDRSIGVTLGAADYFLRVYTEDNSLNTNYILNVEALATPPTTPTDPGSTFSAALDIGALSSRQTFREFVGTVDRSDYYRFSLNQDADFSLLLSGLVADTEVQLFADLNDNGQVDSGEVLVETDRYRTSSDRAFTFLDLEAGTYFVRVYTEENTLNTNYILNLSSTADPTNNPPVAINDNAITELNTEVVIPVLANDNDPNGDPIQLLNFTDPNNGNVRRQGSDLIYTPDPNFTGPDSFTYSISDGNGATDTATVNITVNPAPEDVLQLRVAPSEPIKVAVRNNPVSFDVNYSTEPTETPITGIAFRMHWDSSQVAFDPVTGLTNRFSFGAQSTGVVVEDDPVTNGGFDRDPNTDKYILQAWVDAGGNWPNNSNPTLYRANFTALPGFEGTRINFSANPDSLPANSTFVPSSIALTPRRFTLDIDGNGVVDGLTDAILALRYLIEFRGETLTNNALGEGATRDAAEIVTYLDEARDIMLDVDGNGTAGGLSDGILFLRYALGLTGDALISRAIEEGATRTTETAILDHLQSFDLL